MTDQTTTTLSAALTLQLTKKGTGNSSVTFRCLSEFLGLQVMDNSFLTEKYSQITNQENDNDTSLYLSCIVMIILMTF